MNFVETVEKAIEKRNRILNAKKEELLLLENRKTSIDDDLKEAEKEYFKYIDDEVKVSSYDDKKKEKDEVVKKIDEVKEQIRLLEANFYVDYEMQDIEKELKKNIVNTGLLKDLEKVAKKINELKELAKEIEVKKNNISSEFSEYIQGTRYLPREKQKTYEKEIKDLQEKEINSKIANSDITAFLDHVVGYYRKHKKIFK